MVKVNASARLSARETMAMLVFAHVMQIVEVASTIASQRPLLLEPGVVDALEYAATHDFVNQLLSLAAPAAGALVELLGREEGGKTLGQQTVFAVLELLNAHFEDGHLFSSRPLAVCAITLDRVAKMAISDTNKRLMLQFGELMDTLVKALLLNSPRRDETGGDAVQEASAGVLASLALFGLGAEALRGHGGVMDALRSMRDGVSSTEASRQSAVQALFQLEERKAVRVSFRGGGKHVMMSYNWDHQPVIKRIHSALVQRGYRMWIDVEQMKGSTVDAMSLAVEDAEVVLIGVSRAYKESTNCRLEAQYAMQREVDTVPLMLVEGYQADGWLGMLIGTRMWYGFYGVASSESVVFEGKVEELCRELGERGRNGGLHTTSADDAIELPTPVEAVLGTELGRLSVKQLRERALTAGVSEEAVEDARDTDDSKTALIELLLARHARLGASGEFLTLLSAGGEEASALVVSVLQHTSELLDVLSMSTPRRSRKAVLELLERTESACESVDVLFCDGVAKCGAIEVKGLACLLARVQELDVGAADAESMASVLELLDCLARCGSAVIQSLTVLREDDDRSEPDLLSSLQVLRQLSCQRLEAVSADEMAAAAAILHHFRELTAADTTHVSACMALFTLGCRNGVDICASVEFVDGVGPAAVDKLQALPLAMAQSAGDGVVDALEAVAASSACFLLIYEAVGKTRRNVNSLLDKSRSKAVSAFMGRETAKSFTSTEAYEMAAEVVTRRMFESDDISLACGLANALSFAMVSHLPDLERLHDIGFFEAVWALFGRVCPEPLGEDWWLSTAAVVDVTTARLFGVWSDLILSCKMPASISGRTILASFWNPALSESLRMVKLNASAQLSEGENMSSFSVYAPLQLVEFAAKVESQHALLLESGVVDALDYACAHDFQKTMFNQSIAVPAAGALVYLCGRNEGGKLLSRATVFMVLESACGWTAFGFTRGMQGISRVAIMAISDKTKTLMLEFDRLFDRLLVPMLLLDSSQRGEKGADGLQEASVLVLERLALFGPGADALRAHDDVMVALRALRDGGLSTELSRQSAARALFQLEDRQHQSASLQSRGVAAKHVMVSYNWDHQPVIKRIHSALVQRGYSMWIDVEQMKGSTVDAMSLAVEDAAVVLIGVSRAYKESTNCRLEAQYAMQREVDTVPLMLVEGYQADGWLGMLMGTRMWYGFYGTTVLDVALFDRKMEELCRELGERGRVGTDSIVASVSRVSEDMDRAEGRLRSELEQLTVRELRKRAVASGVSEDAVEEARDADDPKVALVALLVSRQAEVGV
jgi:hypothetical protein